MNAAGEYRYPLPKLHALKGDRYSFSRCSKRAIPQNHKKFDLGEYGNKTVSLDAVRTNVISTASYTLPDDNALVGQLF